MMAATHSKMQAHRRTCCCNGSVSTACAGWLLMLRAAARLAEAAAKSCRRPSSVACNGISCRNKVLGIRQAKALYNTDNYKRDKTKAMRNVKCHGTQSGRFTWAAALAGSSAFVLPVAIAMCLKLRSIQRLTC